VIGEEIVSSDCVNGDVEVWKDVLGYEGYYQVSDLGRVKSVSRVITYVDGRQKDIPECILQGSIHRDGYPQVQLTRWCKSKVVKRHKLVSRE
jgi:NUMOD4 motif